MYFFRCLFLFIVFNLHHKERIDTFLTSIYNGEFSRMEVQNLIKNGKVLVNGKIVKKTSFLLKNNDKIEADASVLNALKQENCNIKPKKMKLDIVFENENLFVIDKPVGLTVHPGAGNVSDTLVNGLLAMQENGEITLSDERGKDRLGIVHRLDKDTSGLMVIAKNNKAHRLLGEMFKQHIIDRRYLALVHGVPVPPVGRIENYICRDKKCIQKMKICDKDDNGAKLAITNYKVIKIIQDGKYSLIECKLETGRTHQIRLHMQTIKHPLAGEQLYISGNLRQVDVKNGYNHQMLHSYKLCFIEPITGEEIKLERLPKWYD